MGMEYVSHVVDAAHMHNIGEQSISNKIQAVLELVKNAYDGDALDCTVSFYGKESGGKTVVDKIVIQDSGVGMTRTDILEKLMKVGTPNKAHYAYSPKFGRRVSGAKGMGHYSMQRLGAKTVITTTPERYEGRNLEPSDDATYVLEIDWTAYIAGRDLQDVQHRLSTVPKTGAYGTVIEISGLSDEWDIASAYGDLQRLARNLKSLVLPDMLQKDKKRSFSVEIKPVGFNLNLSEPKGALLDHATYKLQASLRGDKIIIRTYRNDKKSGKLVDWDRKSLATDAVCGDATFKLYWFSSKLRPWSKGVIGARVLQDQLRDNHGIKIYNDGVRIMPYGEQDNDWLGLDARKTGPESAGLVRNKALIGFVELARSKNPEIVETTTREAVKENEAFRSLREGFVMKAIEYLEDKVRDWVAMEADKEKKTEPGNIAMAEIGRVRKALAKGALDREDTKALLLSLEQAHKQIGEQSRKHKTSQEGLATKVETYRNLATVGVQTIAFNHEILDPIRFVNLALTNMHRLNGSMSEADREASVRKALDKTTHTLNWAVRIREFSSMLAGSEELQKRAPVAVLDSLLSIKKGMSAVLALTATEIDVDVRPDVQDIVMNKASFESIFINLLSNSVRALKSVNGRQRRIRISARKNRDRVWFRFEDNGCGIPGANQDRVFAPFFTTYASASDPGTGMGLAIVKDIVEQDYGGAVSLAETVDERKNPGRGMTAFKIELPAGVR